MRRLAALRLSALALLPGCFTVAISRSAERAPTPVTIPLSDGVSLTSTGEVDINGSAFLPAGVRIDTPDSTIYIDPMVIDDPRPADLILLTHAHPDHMSPPDIRRIATPETFLLGPQSVADELPDYEVRVVAPGDTGSIDGIQYEAVAAYNIAKQFHPRANGWVGYVVEMGGERIYIAGDTEGIPEMRALKNIDVAFIPMNLPYTMPPEEAADAVKAFHPKVVYPYHYRGSDLSVFEKALAGTGIDARLRNWYP